VETRKLLNKFLQENKNQVRKIRKELGKSQTFGLRDSSSSGGSTFSMED
jgi:hypothetical protein